jgi:hypothetical protein
MHPDLSQSLPRALPWSRPTILARGRIDKQIALGKLALRYDAADGFLQDKRNL